MRYKKRERWESSVSLTCIALDNIFVVVELRLWDCFQMNFQVNSVTSTSINDLRKLLKAWRNSEDATEAETSAATLQNLFSLLKHFLSSATVISLCFVVKRSSLWQNNARSTVFLRLLVVCSSSEAEAKAVASMRAHCLNNFVWFNEICWFCVQTELYDDLSHARNINFNLRCFLS